MQFDADLEIDGRKKSCSGLIAELEKAMKNAEVSKLSIIVQDVPTKIDVYAWAKRKGHRIGSEIPSEGMFRMELFR